MNILFVEWLSITNKEIQDVLTKLGHKVYASRIKFTSWSKDEKFLEEFEKVLDELSEDVRLDFVFSVNYFDMVAEACHRRHLKYLAWAYDSPVELGDRGILKYDTNYVFLFDKKEAERYQKEGYGHVYYLPLAVDVKRYSAIKLTPEEREVLCSDISFIGRIYDTDLPKNMESLSDYSKAYINAMVDAQSQIYGMNLFDSMISKDFMEFIGTPEFNRLMNKKEKMPWDDSEQEQEDVSEEPAPSGKLWIELNKLVTNRERLLIINLLSKYFHFKLFTFHKDERLPYAINCGTADYQRDAPKVFKASKINLNITVRYIATAIPLRCLDIMGCGGFLMTNYQEGLMEHFVEDKDLIIYHNPEDAFEKASFYLDPKNDVLREKIAYSGYKKVKKYYNYPDKFREMFHIAGVGEFV